MKVKDFEGRTHSWNLALYTNNERPNCSALHCRARVLLKTLFPCEPLLEEVGLPGTRMFADFYIHAQRLMIEVNGQQHYKANSHFFGTKMDFYRSQGRDRKKKEWCDINGLTLVTLPFNEDDDEWTKRIKSSNSEG